MKKQKREEKSLKIFYAQRILCNKFGINENLSDLISNLMINFYEKFFNDFNYEKMKHYRNAYSNLLMCAGSIGYYQLDFYIGLMDKDTLTYKFTQEKAIEKIIEIIGDCTIIPSIGSYIRNNGEKIIIKTLKVTKFFDKYPQDYDHDIAYKLKEIFNQDSIITNIIRSYETNFNNETKKSKEYIYSVMEEYNLSWKQAVQAVNSGW